MLGTTIAHYKITAKLGQGGMGEVYRATDTKLDREVAIKVLPTDISGDPQSLARFEREAKALAALNHPHIASIHGFDTDRDTHFLVLELVEGDTLHQRLRRGPLSVDESLHVARQIAEAIEAAHARGIIHRDLKPGNIKLTPEGQVKVLDFGLAKMEESVRSQGMSESDPEAPTLPAETTRAGAVIGTPAYMSPEQARGQEVDKRTDIWAFGCVLYECLTGQKAFQGEDVTDILAKIIQGTPDWTTLPQNTPVTVQLLTRKCLVKDRKKRQQHIDDAIVDLDQAISDPSSSIISLSGQALTESCKSEGISKALTTGIAIMALFVGALVTWLLKPQPPPPEQVPLAADILLPHKYPITSWYNDNGFTISPNGDFVIYNLHDSSGGLHRHDLTTWDDIKIFGAQGKDNEGHPFLSYDGSKLGMIASDELVTVPVNGGNPTIIFTEKMLWVNFQGADWSEHDQIVFSSYLEPLRLVSAGGGDTSPITDLGENSDHAFPQFLPGGKHVLFTVMPRFHSAIPGHAEVVNLETGERKEIGVPKSDFSMYVHSGHLLYSLGSDVYAIRFDLETMTTKGSEVKILQNVGRNRKRLLLDVSDNGTLVYLDRPVSEVEQITLAWIDKNNQLEPFTQESGDWESFSLSPDEKSVAILQAGNIYLLTKQGAGFETFQPLVKDGSSNISPVWSHDGKSIYYWSDRDGKGGIYNVEPDFISTPELVLESERQAYPNSATSAFLYVALTPRPTWDVARLVLNSSEPKLEMIPWLSDSNYHEVWPEISPDGKHIFFFRAIADEEGLPLCVSAIENPALNIITEFGVRPRWSKSGSGVYYIWDNSIFLTPLKYEGNLISRQESELFCTVPSISEGFEWDISNDDSRALILIDKRYVKTDLEEEETTLSPTHLKIKTNWFTELNRLVPLENN